jgi:hypothetical protein
VSSRATSLQVIGAGLPRTGTSSLKQALEWLLGGRCAHMSTIPGHPFDLGAEWQRALAGGTPDWEKVFAGYVAAVDWPASMFWRELTAENPDALVILSMRDSAEVWWRSLDEMVLTYARQCLDADWKEGRDLVVLLEWFTGTRQWDDPALLQAAYERHNAAVRTTVPARQLLEWRADDGWRPLCLALELPEPDAPFPRIDGRSR